MSVHYAASVRWPDEDEYSLDQDDVSISNFHIRLVICNFSEQAAKMSIGMHRHVYNNYVNDPYQREFIRDGSRMGSRYTGPPCWWVVVSGPCLRLSSSSCSTSSCQACSQSHEVRICSSHVHLHVAWGS